VNYFPRKIIPSKILPLRELGCTIGLEQRRFGKLIVFRIFFKGKSVVNLIPASKRVEERGSYGTL
jgi:hypothetical protein